ncbi:MAG: FMN-binding glutamate synthase family protein, partial [Candidatus Bathyarchaeia archaeon]
TFDGAEGGTGMSPVPMMDEMGTPTVYLEAQVLKCAQILRRKGRYVPDIVMAGGFINETQMFKAIAMSNFGDGPYVKAILMGRSPLTAVMKANYFVELAKEGKLPKAFVDKYGDNPERFFVGVMTIKANNGGKLDGIPWEAIGLYDYLHERVGVGLQQLMAGCRKWKLSLLSRSDIVSLTERAKKVTGIPMPDDIAEESLEALLD